MTANDLADLIGMCGDGGYNQDAATMLRQQQAEIEALKAKLSLWEEFGRQVVGTTSNEGTR